MITIDSRKTVSVLFLGIFLSFFLLSTPFTKTLCLEVIDFGLGIGFVIEPLEIFLLSSVIFALLLFFESSL